ncbi:MAG: ATP-dependent DNA helicase RecG [Bacteroidales bacterium]|nr:ATP-dependent DNA helicase RecG [Bacteroidales bacterium]
MSDYLKTEITYLEGVGPKRALMLEKEIGIANFYDLLYYFPYKYVDRTKFYTISELETSLPYVQVKGEIEGFYFEGGGRNKRLAANFTDETGSLKLIWFKGIKWITNRYKPGIKYILFGKPALFNGLINIIHPELEEEGGSERKITAGLQAHYSTTEKLKDSFITSRTIGKMVSNVFTRLPGTIQETLPSWMISKYNLKELHDALLTIHFPDSNRELERAIYRLKFEELFIIQLSLLRYKATRNLYLKGHIFSVVGDKFNTFYRKCLPFELTEAQKRVIREIRRDLGSGRQMNRLLQGDVGSGKTMVALMSMLLAADNGFQSCLMAPTEILASQHYATIREFTEETGTVVRLLTGSTKKKERNEIATLLADGTIEILIGTHALIEETVIFKRLGLAVIDEQHRFGVAQRATLWNKENSPPHVLVMTATPIPRTLAMTLYGDLDVSVIDELPPGRKSIKTLHFTDSERLRVFGFMKKQIGAGRQVYIVYPLIRESEKMDYKNLEEGVEAITRAFPPPLYSISVVHGQMSSAEKESSMRLFKKGIAKILIATTVIEVGVDIRNATVMMIESAERFGLSQLHQLRGRVGRGADQSYCILMSADKLSNEARKRIDIMVATGDGFEIAEADLQLRGPGDLEGTQQSGTGFDLRIANLGRDGQLLEYVRRVAEEITDRDPDLQKPENSILRKLLAKDKISEVDWGRIS